MTWSPSEAYMAALIGALATYLWRGFGVAVGSRIDPQGRFFAWLSCVAYAVLAALILRLIAFPAGSLADLPATARIGAAVLAAVAFLLLRRNVFLGCVAGSGAIAVAAAMP
jgi:branched-subunit amino acid transport protein